MTITISNRINEIIKALNLNNSSFAKSIGVSSTTIDGFTKGRRNSKGELIKSQPSFDVILKLVTIHNVNADYILGLSKEMFKDSDKEIIGDLPEHVVDNWDEFMKDRLFSATFRAKAGEYWISLRDNSE